MQKLFFTAAVGSLAAALTACQPASQNIATTHPVAEIGMMHISGRAAYRERIALLPGSIFDVQLLDVSRMDAPATIISRQTRVLNQEQVPLQFLLDVREHKLKTNMRYAVRATISTSDGALAWSTDTSYPVNPSLPAQDLGTLKLVRVASSPSGANLLKATHLIGDINGAAPYAGSVVSVTFGNDGRISGETGCNNFMGSYTAEGKSIGIGPLATTRKLCTPELNDQEARVLAVMRDVTSWEIDRFGRFVFKASDGRSLTTSSY